MTSGIKFVCFLILTVLFLNKATAQGNDVGVRPLPPTASTPRDPLEAAEWIWTREEEGGTLPELYPDEWQLFWQRTKDLGIGKSGGASLLRVAGALWDDYGSADMNLANQLFLTGVLADELGRSGSRVSSDEAERLRHLLREYIEAGGALVRPEITANVGAALASVSDGNEVDIELAEGLVFEALTWEAEICGITGFDVDSSVLRAAISQFGPGVRLEVYDLVECTVVASAEPECYRKRCGTLAKLCEALALPRGDRNRPRRVEQLVAQACAEAVRDCGSEAAREDLVVRFLIAVDVLGRVEGARLPGRTHTRICDTLARLARDGDLLGERAWRQWAEAVRVMGRKELTSALRGFLRVGLDPAKGACPLDPATRAMLRSLADTERNRDLRRNNSQKPEKPGGYKRSPAKP